MSTAVIIPSSSNNLDSSITELLLTVTTSSVNILISSTSTIVFQGQDNGKNNPVILITAVSVPTLLILLTVCISAITCLTVYHQRQKKRNSTVSVPNDAYDSLRHFNHSNTLKQTSNDVIKVVRYNISNPVYEGN